LIPNYSFLSKLVGKAKTTSFGVGASFSSFIFFFFIGYLSKHFSKFLNKPNIWKFLNIVIIIFMIFIIIFVIFDMIDSNL